MGKIYISVGISGSGKSRFAETFCKTSEAIELNADNYRKELGKGVNDQDINKVVFEEIDIANCSDEEKDESEEELDANMIISTDNIIFWADGIHTLINYKNCSS